MEKIIAPSMLSADFGHLERDTKMVDASRAAWVHVDVMDGVFVPNISFGFPVLKAIRAATKKLVDVHIMIIEPGRYAAKFVEAGADMVTFHWEAVEGMQGAMEVVDAIHKAGGKAGISVKPATPVSVLGDILPHVDLVLIMSVEPGFGGQSFIEGSWDKVRELRAMIDSRGLKTLIEIDGGIGPQNAAALFEAGCDVLVAGNAVFKSPDPARTIGEMLNNQTI